MKNTVVQEIEALESKLAQKLKDLVVEDIRREALVKQKLETLRHPRYAIVESTFILLGSKVNSILDPLNHVKETIKAIGAKLKKDKAKWEGAESSLRDRAQALAELAKV